MLSPFCSQLSHVKRRRYAAAMQNSQSVASMIKSLHAVTDVTACTGLWGAFGFEIIHNKGGTLPLPPVADTS